MTKNTQVKKVTHAAVGIIEQQDGRVLLAERPEGKPWSGYWEFPGGKVEPGESAQAALCRELKEEIGITVVKVYPWLTRCFDYPAKLNDAGEVTSLAKTVKLYFFVVTEWLGQPKGLENQQLSWQSAGSMNVSPMLPANTPIFQALKLPRITRLSDLNNHDVLISSQVLMTLEQRPEGERCGALCVGAQSLQRAAQFNLDYVVLALENGWGAFSQLIQDYPLPVYALGVDDLHIARTHGAHGITHI